MTREEAIIQLRFGPGINEDVSEEYNDAVNIAIEILEQESNEDLISRKDVIDGLEHEVELYNRALDDMDINRKERERFEWELELVECFIEDINELPSKGIINTKSVFNLSEDVISRQTAIDTLAKEMPSLTTPDGCGEFDHDIQITDEAFVDCMQIINGLPSAQPERKKGKWIIDNKETGRIWHCHCSNCRKDPQDHIGGTENWWLVRLPKYCPNCGADMRGDEE